MSKKIKEQFFHLTDEHSAPFPLKGKDIKLNLPKELMISSSELRPALEVPLRELTRLVQDLLEEIPAELAGDTIDKGIILSGGSAMLSGIDTYLAQVLGIPVSVAEECDLCVIKGIRIALDHLDLYRQSLAYGYL